MLTWEQADRVGEGIIAAARVQSTAEAERLTGGITRMYPELKAWPAGERRAVLRAAERAMAWDWRQGLVLAMAVAVFALAVVAFVRQRHVYYWISSTIPVFFVLSQWSRRAAIRRRLRLMVSERRVNKEVGV